MLHLDLRRDLFAHLQALERASAGRTTLIIGHGIESLLDSVRIVHLRNGRVIADEAATQAI